MKKLILIGLLALIVMFPSVVLAGNVYWNADATFHNSAKFTKPGLPGAKGTATIRYNAAVQEWTVTLKFSGLLKYHDYIFQFGVQDQLRDRYDCSVKTDKAGGLKTTFVISDLDFTFQNIQYPPLEHNPDVGYTILRLIDLSGQSGGILLDSLEPNDEYPEDDPYAGSPATMVMRAREDGAYG